MDFVLDLRLFIHNNTRRDENRSGLVLDADKRTNIRFRLAFWPVDIGL
jgi:hypothetical protein